MPARLGVAGVRVPPALVDAWQAWLAPSPQPFFVDDAVASDLGLRAGDRTLSPELRDTYATWRIDGALGVVWLDEGTFHALPRAARARLVRAQVAFRRDAVPTVRGWRDVLPVEVVAAQADGHRFVWWPSLVTPDPHPVLQRVATAHNAPSRHRDVAADTWRRCASALPSARALAGSFSSSSGPNCFGTVLAAAGVGDADERCVEEDEFDAWLGARTTPGGHDDTPGTVLVWRAGDGRPVHAAVCLGDGWALEKPSQCWYTARVVDTADAIKRVNRARGARLHRATIC